MIAQISIYDKSFGSVSLYKDLELTINEGEKIGLIGRNGTGKSTLFNIISGEDKNYDGDVVLKKGLVVTSSRQEHQDFEEKTVLGYILDDLPEFTKLKWALDNLPEKMGDDTKLMQQYSDAIERFGILGYYDVENDVKMALDKYQIGEDKASMKLGSLSGGQKRLVELVKVQRARADLALIDEPTNHMDYVAKESFIKWFKATKEAVIVISHDRDVLRSVDKIIEIRDGQTDITSGGYDQFLSSNTNRITSEVNEYTVVQRRVTNLRSDIVRLQRLKEKARNPGTIKRFKGQEMRAREELKKLEATDKPSFWIDQESAGGLKTKMADAYEEHKTKNISIKTTGKLSGQNRKLIQIKDLSLGYDDNPLFSGMNLELREGDRLQVHGRNGVGKSTLVQAIIGVVNDEEVKSKIFGGEILPERLTNVGVYEQELDAKYLPMKLSDAIEMVHHERDIECDNQQVKNLLSDYLFNPAFDGNKPIKILSGGQKARFQLMSMLAGNPSLLILDEPTNHLDLPSIEELEQALSQYRGAVVYISHDSYFVSKLGGKRITL